MPERFRFVPQHIPEVLLIEQQRFGDARGFFTETFRHDVYAKAGLPPFVQENHSRSTRGVLRGLHYQDEPEAIGKLVTCVRGRIFDVAVDVRRGSPTYGQWVGMEIGEQRPVMLYVPVGFAHGFCALSESADVVYKQTGYYSPEHERTVRWNDPAIGIDWPIAQPQLSPKDAEARLLAEVDSHFAYPPAAGGGKE
jgi:dTDP-4-dehydrorhamnose 3,5-epimerase